MEDNAQPSWQVARPLMSCQSRSSFPRQEGWEQVQRLCAVEATSAGGSVQRETSLPLLSLPSQRPTPGTTPCPFPQPFFPCFLLSLLLPSSFCPIACSEEKPHTWCLVAGEEKGRDRKVSRLRKSHAKVSAWL